MVVEEFLHIALLYLVTNNTRNIIIVAAFEQYFEKNNGMTSVQMIL